MDYLQLESFEELVVLGFGPALAGLGNGVGFSDLLGKVVGRRRRRRCGSGGSGESSQTREGHYGRVQEDGFGWVRVHGNHVYWVYHLCAFCLCSSDNNFYFKKYYIYTVLITITSRILISTLPIFLLTLLLLTLDPNLTVLKIKRKQQLQYKDGIVEKSPKS